MAAFSRLAARSARGRAPRSLIATSLFVRPPPHPLRPSPARRLSSSPFSHAGAAGRLEAIGARTVSDSSRVALGATAPTRLEVIDAHAAGEPARVVVGGMPAVPGGTMGEKRAYVMEHLDGLRQLLLREPRGYPCQNVNFLLPATRPEAAFGYVIGEQNRVYPMMSGHNTICVATALLETGRVAMEYPVTRFALEAPAGLIQIEAVCRDGRAESITLRNQPAFCRDKDIGVEVEVPHLGRVEVSVAYGGMWYAIVDAAAIGLRLEPSNGREIVRLGEMIKVATREQHPVDHPEFAYGGPDILCFRGESSRRADGVLRARNAVVMSNGELDWGKPETWTGMIDRSPCGSGTCAVMALLHRRGELALHEDFVHESIIGSEFVGRLHATTIVGKGTSAETAAVVPSIRGSAWLTAHATILCHPTDPFPEGYSVGDIW